MKKLLSILAGVVLSFGLLQSAQAKTIQVSALEDFQTNNPPQIIHIQMNANTKLDNELMLFQGYQVTGRIVARNGGFIFVPVSYVNFQEEKLPVRQEVQAVYRGNGGVIRQYQPFYLVFPEVEPEPFQYYVPSSSDM